MTSRRAFLTAAAYSALAHPLSRLNSAAASPPAPPAPVTSPTPPGAAPPTDCGPLLLVDEHHILYRSGTRRIFHPLKRHPANPIIKGRDKPWEVAIAFNNVHRDPASGRYQMWYQSYAGPAARDKTRSCTVCYAESTDGIHWTKPELDLFDFNDIKRTNLVLIANGGRSDRYGASVIVDPRDQDPARRYKMAYFDFSGDDGQEYPGLSVAFSPDGIHWTKYPQAPLLRAAYGDVGDAIPFQDQAQAKPWARPLSIADAFDAMFDPVRQAYALYGKMWIDSPEGTMYWKHAVQRTISKDFVHWERPELIMTPDDDDPAYVEFHTTPVFYYGGCYFAAPQVLHRQERGGVMDVELAVSRDGVNFARPFRKTFWLPKNPAANAFDSGTIVTNSTPVILEDEMRFYYGGYSMGATGADDNNQISGVGLATMPRDRFAGIRPVERIGQVTLKPLDLSRAGGITLNASAAGTVHVELLDENGYRVRGFAKDDAVPISGDSLRHRVSWKAKRLRDLPPGRYMPRLHLDRAEVFAINLPESDDAHPHG